MLKIFALHPNHINSYGIGHAALQIVNAMSGANINARILCVSHNSDMTHSVLMQRYSPFTQKVVYRCKSQAELGRKTEARFLDLLEKNEVAYLWPGCSLRLYREISKRGNLIVTELVNCHDRVAKSIFDKEFSNLGLQASEMVSNESIDVLDEKISLSRIVFSPSDSVTASLEQSGVELNKVITSSYGLEDHQRLVRDGFTSIKNKKIKAIFVGRAGVRKGIHLLLDYWCSSEVQGELLIIGEIEDEVKGELEKYRGIKGIHFIDFVANVTECMNAADMFLFPSLEEGSPLVLYLALGAGLPCIVSPMAGAGIVEDRVTGRIIEPHDAKAWIQAINQFAENNLLRQSYGKKAFELSEHYLWSKVGERRAMLLVDKVNDTKNYVGQVR